MKPQVTAGASDRLRVTGVTCVATWAGTVHITFAADVPSRRITGWTTSIPKETTLILDAIDIGLQQQGYHWAEGTGKLVRQSDAGNQHTPSRFTQHLTKSGTGAPIGATGDAPGNALAKSTIDLHAIELIKPREPWHTIREADVTITT